MKILFIDIAKASDRNIARMDHVYKELSAKIKYLENQQTEDRSETLKRENLFTFKTDTENVQRQVLKLENRVQEYNTEYDDTLSEFK